MLELKVLCPIVTTGMETQRYVKEWNQEFYTDL